MEIDNIFSKFNSKDYNNQLEKILEDKDYSETVKNLLLSMLYKIETGYKDYITVKRIVESKKTYLGEILDIIKNKCNKIIVVDEESEEAKEMNNNNFLVDKLEGKIFLKYPNERLLLYTIYKIDDKQLYLDEKYNLIRVAFSELLNAGENINNIEVLRDFNGWNWNTQVNEISEITTNLVYQNLIYLLGIDFIKQLIHTDKVVDYINLIEARLSKLYNEENSKEILKQIYKISIIICTSKNERELKRLQDEKNFLQTELNRLKDKKNLLNEISNSKKEALRDIKQIDSILNDKEMLEKEFIKRNEKRAQYNKIFNPTHLTEILNRERKKLLQKIEEANHLLDPKFYVKTIKELEEQLEMLEDIDLEETKKEEKKKEYVLKLQEVFLNCFNIKIENIQDKEELVNLIYMLRYYKLINITKNQQIMDVKSLERILNLTQEVLLKKAYELKVINKISSEESINNEIIKNLLKTRIISLENINIELKKNDTMLEVSIYDANIYEKTIVIPNFDKDKINIKFNKVFKVFI